MNLDTFIEQAEEIKQDIHFGKNRFVLRDTLKYSIWKNLLERYLLTEYPKDICNKKFTEYINAFEANCSIEHIEQIQGLLKSLIKIDRVVIISENIDKSISNPVFNISNNNSQSQQQSQEQNIVLGIFLEAIKDELNGKQRKELLEIAKEEKDPDKAKRKIQEKIESFGLNVSAGILTNIITNPLTWSSLSGLV